MTDGPDRATIAAMPTPRRWIRVLVMVAAGLASQRAAHAETITDPATSLSLDFAPRGARVCVLVPVERADETACGGLTPDRKAMATTRMERFRNAPLFVANALFDGWFFTIAIMRSPPDEIDNLETYAEEMRASIADRGVELVQPMPPPRSTRINGVEVVQLSTGTRKNVDGGNVEEWISSYALLGNEASYVIYAKTEAAHEGDMTAAMQTALSTLKLTPARSRPERTPVGTNELVWYSAEAVMGLVGAFTILWLVARRRRSAAVPPPSPLKTKSRDEDREVR